MPLPHRLILPVLAATAIGLTSVAHAADSKEIASVNGKSITQQDYDQFLSENTKGNSGQINRQQVINELVSRELVYQDAIKKGIDKDPEVLQKLEAVKLSLIIGAALDKAMSNPPLKDAELKKIYKEKVAEFNQKEYKASHILLKSKEEAEKVITELDMGGKFADLAKKKSTGPTGKNGGDLGWFAPQQMVPEFSAAVLKLEKGKYTKQPVQTKFGFHVIKLEDSRQAEPPSFDAVKPQLQRGIQQQRANAYLQSLKEKADIKIK
jgi:peptidyl-prolyl cis-trans isomerase C